MNPFIKKELEKVRADLPEYNENTTHIVIPQKIIGNSFNFITGKKYRIKVDNFILNKDSILTSNWNNGLVINDEYMDIVVNKSNSTMVLCNAYGFDNTNNHINSNIYNNVWLPKQNIVVLGEYR